MVFMLVPAPCNSAPAALQPATLKDQSMISASRRLRREHDDSAGAGKTG
jgi:hypothetical protein